MNCHRGKTVIELDSYWLNWTGYMRCHLHADVTKLTQTTAPLRVDSAQYILCDFYTHGVEPLSAAITLYHLPLFWQPALAEDLHSGQP